MCIYIYILYCMKDYEKDAATKKQRPISRDPGILEELHCQCLPSGMSVTAKQYLLMF